VPHPFLYAILYIPFGALSGYLGVALAYTLAQDGVPVERIGALVALSYIPHAWKFLWAPIVDTTLTRHRWYLIAVLCSGAGAWAMGIGATHPNAWALLSALVLLANLANTFLGMAVESLLAHGTPEALKGRAGGWLQVGNLGGGGLGGGAALWIAERSGSPPLAGALMCASFLACGLALRFVGGEGGLVRQHDLARTLKALLRDLWQVARARGGYLALLVVFLPISTGAASNLWSAVASDWHASADAVALANGTFGGLVSAVGCLLGGSLCDRFPRKICYVVFGLLMSGCAVAMGLAPHTQAAYVVFTLAYALVNGLVYAAFSAVTLEAMGLGAAATKYNLFASLANVPIAYMTALEGWVRSRAGVNSFLYFEAAMSVLALGVFIGASVWSARRELRPAAAV
jgi:MFS family permease